MSPPKKPRTAIVVGSGCSLGLGVPVMAGFLDSLLDRLSSASGSYPSAGEDLRYIREFIATAKGSAAYVRADLLNIEEMYGMADMDEDLTAKNGNGDATEVKKAFNRAIFHIAKDAGKEFLEGAAAHNFPKDERSLEHLKRESQTEEPLHRNLGTRWTNLLAYLCLASFKDRDGSHPLFIQFNWDLGLDRALFRWSLLRPDDDQNQPLKKLKNERDNVGYVTKLPWYGTPENGHHDYHQWPRVTRPHGGINWVDNERKAVSRTKLPDCYRIKESNNNDIWIDPRPVLRVKPGKAHAWDNGEHMAIVPPTWRKQATRLAYQDQWQFIKDGLSDVRRIIFIGYSLPKTDLYFRHFLALALAENNHLPKVYAMNPSILEPGTVRDNYLDLFAPLAREGRLYGIQGRFGDPALFDLHRALALAKPIKP